MQNIIDIADTFLIKNYKREKIVFTKGKGTRLFDANGNEYIDFCAGIAVCNLGHCHPALVEELCNQVNELWHVSNLYYLKPQALLAKKLAQLSFGERVFFANSGTEAIETALKLARKWAYENFGEEKIEYIALENSFHGRTLGALSITGQPNYKKGFEPLIPGVKFVNPKDLNSLKNAFSQKVCAVFLEIVQGEGGVYLLKKEFISLAKELCEKYKALLIFDEIQTGIGRTGKLFAYEHYGIEPDIMCLAKALANGLPLSAVITKESIAQTLTPGSHGSTFGGNPIACKVALKVLEIISDPLFLKEVQIKGKIFMEKLNKLKEKYPKVIKEIRGLGLLIGIEFWDKVEKIYNFLLKQKILVTAPKPNILRLTPPLIITYKEIDHFVDVLSQGLKEIYES